MEITLTFDLTEVNVILAALSEAPFRIADPVIKKIQAQAEPQVQAAGGTTVEAKAIPASKKA
jgi:hypothetical protein